jgi:hypothetical protein
VTSEPSVAAGGLDADTLRALVREVLREMLPASSAPALALSAPVQPGPVPPAPARPMPAPARPMPAPAQPMPAPPQSGPIFTVRDGVEAVETVSVRTDQELAAFAARLLHLFENPKHRDDLRAGRLRFRLAASGPAGSARPAHRIEKGAVTEAAVKDAARAGARLVLGRRAVLTPLARDRARSAGVEIEKER